MTEPRPAAEPHHPTAHVRVRPQASHGEARVTLIRAGARGLERFGSLYLISALLVLAGGYATLYSGGRPISVALNRVLGAQFAYTAALVMVLACLHRIRRETRDPLLLTGIVCVFLLDALLVQHLYGWTSQDGRIAAFGGASASLMLLAALALALRLPLHGRPIISMGCAILFSRLAPLLLIGAVPEELAPRHVALGFLLAACALPGILLPDLRAPRELPARILDVGGTLTALGAADAHFAAAGASFDLPLRFAYLAPVIIVLPALIERLVPELASSPAVARLAAGLPYLGLALSATHFTPGLLAAEWAQSWPLTPFTLCLGLVVIVEGLRAARRKDIALAHCVVALAAVGTLGGDMPAILASAVYPTPLQLATLVLIAGTFIAITRRLVPGSALHCLVAFVAAGALATLGIPWIVAWIMLIAWGPLLISAAARDAKPLADPLRASLAAVAMLPAVVLLLAEHDSLPRLALASASCALGLIVARLTGDRLLAVISGASAGLGLIGWPVSLQVRGGVAPGMLMMEAGVVVLLLAFLHSLMRDRIHEALNPPPSPPA